MKHKKGSVLNDFQKPACDNMINISNNFFSSYLPKKPPFLVCTSTVATGEFSISYLTCYAFPYVKKQFTCFLRRVFDLHIVFEDNKSTVMEASVII